MLEAEYRVLNVIPIGRDSAILTFGVQVLDSAWLLSPAWGVIRQKRTQLAAFLGQEGRLCGRTNPNEANGSGESWRR